MNDAVLFVIGLIFVAIIVLVILWKAGKLDTFCGGKKHEGFCGCGAMGGNSTGVPVK